ncbi:MAG: FAD-dependent oxidoreductase [Pseudomonadota bacterium]
MDEFSHIFDPIKIGNVVIPNRVYFTAHHSRIQPVLGAPNDDQIAYFEERAKNGVGLIIASITHPAPMTTVPTYVSAVDDKAIPLWAKQAEAIHRHGTKVIAQMAHYGKLGSPHGAGGATLGPSATEVPGLLPRACEVCHEMDKDEIAEMVEVWVHAAINMKKADYDGIQISAVRGMLVASFISAAMNKRKDEYGGSLENRLRFPIEIIEKTRAAVGPDFLMGVRFDCDEFVEGGTSLDEGKKIAQIFEATGQMDFIEIGQGAERMAHIPSMYFPLGAFIHLGAAVKSVVKIPVIQGGRINDPVMAEQVLKDNLVDMVGMARPFIADPEFLKKTREGRVDEIRKCIACVESCGSRYIEAAIPVRCVLNPEAGREREFGIKPAQVKKRVMVIGGGPAGCEAARVAAIRGHQVVLYEKENELGGQLKIAGKAPGRLDFLEPPRWYTLQLKKLGVEVHLGTGATAEMIREKRPDAVVVATGSVPGKLDAPGGDRSTVVGVRDVLQEKVEAGNHVVVVDQGHHMEGLSVSDWLSERGKSVELLSPAVYAGGQVDTATLQILYTRLLKKGVRLTPMTRVKAIEEKAVIVANVLTGVERRIEPVDTVVLADVGTADDHLYRALKGEIKELFLIGAALAPRRALHAFWEGAKSGREI